MGRGRCVPVAVNTEQPCYNQAGLHLLDYRSDFPPHQELRVFRGASPGHRYAT